MIGRRESFRYAMMGVICLTTSSLIACKLPVFRYALERWSVDRYRMVAVIDGESSEQVVEAIAQLDRIDGSHANVEVETIDLSKLSEEQLWQVEGLDGDLQPPLLQVFFPERDGRRKLCWSGELTSETVGRWPMSKLRQQIVDDITSGVSAVWVLVEGSDRGENERMADGLQSALSKAALDISIPEGVIARQDSSEYLRDHPGASMDDVLRSDIPLRVDFTLRRLASDDDSESALRAIIAGWNTQLTPESDGAFVFPVFGRGRMIEPLAADSFSEEGVIAACRYMVGECNCTLKALNPGVDLILDTDWREYLGDSLLIVDNASVTTAERVAIPEGKPQRETGSSPEAAPPLNLRPLIIAMAMIMFLVIGVRQAMIQRR